MSSSSRPLTAALALLLVAALASAAEPPTAAEVETDYGHVLVYGVNEDILARFDFADVRLPAQTLIREVDRLGGVALAFGTVERRLQIVGQPGVAADRFVQIRERSIPLA